MNRSVKGKHGSGKWLIACVAVFLVAILLVGVMLQVFGKGKVKPSEWFDKPEIAPTEEVLKIEWQNLKNGAWHEYGQLSAVPLCEALETMTDEQVRNATITYRIYNDSDYKYQASFRFKDGPIDEAGKGGRKGVSDYIEKHAWTDISFRLDNLLSANNGFDCEPGELKDILNCLVFFLSGYDKSLTDFVETVDFDERYPATGAKLTLYVSNISLVVPDGDSSRSITAYDFSRDEMDRYFIDSNCCEMTAVEASSVPAAVETPDTEDETETADEAEAEAHVE